MLLSNNVEEAQMWKKCIKVSQLYFYMVNILKENCSISRLLLFNLPVNKCLNYRNKFVNTESKISSKITA